MTRPIKLFRCVYALLSNIALMHRDVNGYSSNVALHQVLAWNITRKLITNWTRYDHSIFKRMVISCSIRYQLTCKLITNWTRYDHSFKNRMVISCSIRYQLTGNISRQNLMQSNIRWITINITVHESDVWEKCVNTSEKFDWSCHIEIFGNSLSWNLH